MADDAKKADDADLAKQTEQEADEAGGLLTPQKHMQFIEESNKRAEAEQKALEDAQRAQAKALLSGDDDAKENVKAATKQTATQGDKA